MHTKEDIVNEIRRIASKLGQDSLSMREFRKNSVISVDSVLNRFVCWNDAVAEAGLVPIDSAEAGRKHAIERRIGEEELLSDLYRLYQEYSKEPTGSLVNAKGKFSSDSYRRRWGSVRKAFLIAKDKYSDPLSEVKPASDDYSANATEIKVIPPTIKPKDVEKKRTVFGEPIDFRGLRFAPVNEQGVVFLFGMISRELGYLIESVRTGYPDCEGKRCFDKQKNEWEHVKIEFEFKSSHFSDHGHDSSLCDIIVCWIHDWNDCPLEVLKLKSTIKYLKS